MRVKNASAEAVIVGQDPSGSFIELHTASGGLEGQPSSVFLTREEARRLAAVILLEASKLDAPHADDWLPLEPDRRSA